MIVLQSVSDKVECLEPILVCLMDVCACVWLLMVWVQMRILENIREESRTDSHHKDKSVPTNPGLVNTIQEIFSIIGAFINEAVGFARLVYQRGLVTWAPVYQAFVCRRESGWPHVLFIF